MKGKNKNKPAVTRRSFLGTAGLALGVSTLTPVVPVFDSVIKYGNRLLSGNNFRTGILLPVSNIYPGMAENFHAGIKLSTSQAQSQFPQIQFDLKTETVGFGPSSIVHKSRKLIEDDDVDILTGIISESISPDLRKLLDENSKFLVANHPGANILSAHDHSQNIVHNSLNLCQTNYALGIWAAHNIGKKAVVVSSFYESGYDALYAFISGFESEGGSILDTRITNLPSEMGKTNSVISNIRKYPADLVFASFSGTEAAEFVSEYVQSDLNKRLPLLGSGFLVEENMKNNPDALRAGILTSSAWASDLKNEVYQKFQVEYKKMTGRTADAFAVLGYETGTMIAQAAIETNGNMKDLNQLRSMFYNNQISGPRGKLTLNKSTHTYESPIYLRELKKQKGRPENLIISELDSLKEDSMQAEELKTGWLNPYLCA